MLKPYLPFPQVSEKNADASQFSNCENTFEIKKNADKSTFFLCLH